eukprot:TRINITY_DN7485_c0_g1_i1.p1 TRINITY_DN7485_c0_g1~~TRINITY_DN7485_c0_g1_i1.p1  ORF type:complete len:1906 (-),score=343.15 TRINITY_DN7485_c0_g1_i1:318-6035(-)
MSFEGALVEYSEEQEKHVATLPTSSGVTTADVSASLPGPKPSQLVRLEEHQDFKHGHDDIANVAVAVQHDVAERAEVTVTESAVVAVPPETEAAMQAEPLEEAAFPGQKFEETLLPKLPTKLTLTVLSAKGLRAAEGGYWGGANSNPFCICELRGKPESHFQTSSLEKTLEPVWDEEHVVVGYAPGDSLDFTVMDSDDAASSTFLGRATLEDDKISREGGFAGDLVLLDSGSDHVARLKIRVEVVPPSPRRPPSPLAVPVAEAAEDDPIDAEVIPQQHDDVPMLGADQETSTLSPEVASPTEGAVSCAILPSAAGVDAHVVEGVTALEHDAAAMKADRADSTAILEVAAEGTSDSAAAIPLASSAVKLVAPSPTDGSESLHARATPEADDCSRDMEVAFPTPVRRAAAQPSSAFTPLAEHVEPPTKVKVTVVSASALRAADRSLWGDVTSSDPYCVCQLVGKPNTKFKTKTIKKTLDPVWNQEFVVACYAAGDALEFSVMDYDVGKADDFLGRAILDGEELRRAGGFAGDLALADCGTGHEATLRIMVEVLPRTPRFSLPSIVFTPVAAHASPPRKVKVRVLSASGLRAADTALFGGNSSDPYCICQLKGKKATKFQTKRVNKTLEPEWNEEHVVAGYTAGDSVEFTVMDHDLTSSDDFLGNVTLDGEELCRVGGFAGDLALADCGSGHAATLRVVVEVLPRTPRAALPPIDFTPVAAHASPPTKIKVRVINASGLRAADTGLFGGNSSDPYCICQLKGKKATKFQTKRINKTLDPEWNEEHIVPGFTAGDSVQFIVMDHDLTSNDDLLGKATVDGEELCRVGGFSGYLTLTDCGSDCEATLAVQLEILPPTPRAMPTVDFTPLAAYSYPCTTVMVTFLSAAGLRVANGLFDSHCVCQLKGKPESTIQTKRTNNTLEPVWHEEHFIADYEAGDSLEFTVLHDDVPLGRATLDGEELVRVGGFAGDLMLSDCHESRMSALRVQVEVLPPTPRLPPISVPGSLLKVDVFAASGLRKSDAKDLSTETICQCLLEDRPETMAETMPSLDTSEAVWNETLEIPEFDRGDCMVFRVIRIESGSSVGEILGICSLPAHRFDRAEGFDGELTLKNTGDDNKATLKVCVGVAPPWPLPQQKISEPGARLRVMILKASDIHGLKESATERLVCLCKVEGRQEIAFATKPASDIVNPEWNEEHEILAYERGSFVEFMLSIQQPCSESANEIDEHVEMKAHEEIEEEQSTVAVDEGGAAVKDEIPAEIEVMHVGEACASPEAASTAAVATAGDVAQDMGGRGAEVVVVARGFLRDEYFDREDGFEDEVRIRQCGTGHSAFLRVRVEVLPPADSQTLVVTPFYVEGLALDDNDEETISGIVCACWIDGRPKSFAETSSSDSSFRWDQELLLPGFVLSDHVQFSVVDDSPLDNPVGNARFDGKNISSDGCAECALELVKDDSAEKVSSGTLHLRLETMPRCLERRAREAVERQERELQERLTREEEERRVKEEAERRRRLQKERQEKEEALVKARAKNVAVTVNIAPTGDVLTLVRLKGDHTVHDLASTAFRLGRLPMIPILFHRGVQLSPNQMLADAGVADGAQVTAEAFVVMTCSRDRTAKVWNSGTGECMFTLVGHEDTVRFVVSTPDLKWLFTASNDHTAKLWATDRWANLARCTCTLYGHSDPVAIVTFSPDQKMVMTGSDDWTAKIWAVRTGRCMRTIEHNGPVFDVAFGMDGETVSTSARDNEVPTVKVWERSTGILVSSEPLKMPITSQPSVSATCRSVVALNGGPTVEVRDMVSGALVHRLQGHSFEIVFVAFAALQSERVKTLGSNDDVGGELPEINSLSSSIGFSSNGAQRQRSMKRGHALTRSDSYLPTVSPGRWLPQTRKKGQLPTLAPSYGLTSKVCSQTLRQFP